MMSELPPIVDEADLMLARLAKLDLGSVQHVHDCLLDTTKPDEVATLALAQARLSRSCRQNLACLTKLKAERAKAEREAERHERWRRQADDRKTPEDVAYETRAEHLSQAVGRVISHVANGDRERHTELAHRFDRELDDWYEKPDFLVPDLDAHVRQACRRLGLPAEAAARWEHLPDPTFHPEPEVRADEACSEPEDDPATDDAAGPALPLTDTG
jgi:hypothetical protein